MSKKLRVFVIAALVIAMFLTPKPRALRRTGGVCWRTGPCYTIGNMQWCPAQCVR